MKIYSLDKKKIKKSRYQEDLYDLFEKTMTAEKITLTPYTVPREFEMRLDKVSNYLYGTSSYVEELMILNDIVNPLSIKEGQEILFCDISYLPYLYKKDQINDDFDERRDNLIKSSQRKTSEEQQKFLPPTVKPRQLKRISVDTKSRKIKIIRSFK